MTASTRTTPSLGASPGETPERVTMVKMRTAFRVRGLAAGRVDGERGVREARRENVAGRDVTFRFLLDEIGDQSVGSWPCRRASAPSAVRGTAGALLMVRASRRQRRTPATARQSRTF